LSVLSSLPPTRLLSADPVLPVGPELPETSSGLEAALAVAGPVSPVLVADDCAVDAPDPPEVALGSNVPCTEPPSPPLAPALAMESPPVTLPTWRSLSLASPPMNTGGRLSIWKKPPPTARIDTMAEAPPPGPEVASADPPA